MDKKPKIALLSDDARMNSGIATMSRELILRTAHIYDWVQLAGAIQHPEKGKIFDLSQSINDKLGIKNSYVKLYPVDGYGSEQTLFQLISMEKPDAILHFTDPRFWGWLYALEKQIRSSIPICYYAIWDDVPFPMYNRPFYESCDAIFGISKQSDNIHKWVLNPKNCCSITDDKPMDGKVLTHYVPHGIDSDTFKPVAKDDPALLEFKKKLFSDKEFKFVILYNSRNVHRKRTSNIILAYRQFCDNLPKEDAKKCVLILHTEIMQEAGTNLIAVKEALCPEYNITFSPGKLSPEDMNLLYNCADTTVNASSNEGFGLSVAESIMSGTPITVAVTGGIQDQIGQVDDEGNPVVFGPDFGSNNIGKFKKCGPWAYPVWPVTRLVQGSIPTPYIFDDLSKWEDFAEGFMYWYMMGDENRTACGARGREWAMAEGGISAKNMGDQFIAGMQYVFKNWKKPNRFGLFSIKDYVGNTMTEGHMGFEIPKIDTDKLSERIKETLSQLPVK